MGNTSSTTSSSTSTRNRKGRQPESAAERAKKVVGDIQEEFKKSVKTLNDDHPAAQLIDSVCGGYFDDDKYRHSRSASFYSEADYSEDGSRTVEDDDTYDDSHRGRTRDASTVESSSYVSQSDFESEPKPRRRRAANSSSFDTEDDSRHITEDTPQLLSKPLASSFAKRCYFTKSGIGKTTQHYEGLTLTGNVVLMLAAAMKLKGCPTICDEDLRRVEQTYPNQFSRLPDELLLSSGWRRISKYCHFSNKPIPDGVPFFHSKKRLHPSGGFYFLLASAVGMIRPIDLEPLTRDTLVLLETDFPSQCDQAPDMLVRDPDQWTLVEKFCFFSGGPINTEEDVYYRADFDGNPIYMLAFLSPSLTPEELYKLSQSGEPVLKSCKAVEDVESVYDLTDRDFEDLKLYHLGPCRALPQYILHPQAWVKVLPPHFISAKETAMIRAQDYEVKHGTPQQEMQPVAAVSPSPQQQQQHQHQPMSPQMQMQQQQPELSMGAPSGATSPLAMAHSPQAHPHRTQSPLPVDSPAYQQQPQQQHPGGDQYYGTEDHVHHLHQQAMSPNALQQQQQQGMPSVNSHDYQRAVEEEGAFVDNNAPMDEAIASRFPISPRRDVPNPETPKLDPPEDEPPSLMKQNMYGEDPPQVQPPLSQTAPETATSGGMGHEQEGTVFFGAQSPDYFPSPEKEFEPVEDGGREQFGMDQEPYYPQEQDDHFHDDGQFQDPQQQQHMPQDGYYDPNMHQQQVMSPTDYHPEHQDFQAESFGDNGVHYGDEEKKTGTIDDPSDPGVNFDHGMQYDENGQPLAEGEADFTPIKRDGYTLRRGPNTTASPSPRSQTSMGSQSAALRGAQELLKKNRRRRLEMASKSRGEGDAAGHPQSPISSTLSPRDDESAATWESGSEFTASVISGSSVWTDGSNPTEKSSRRALILQMAKARMKSNREGPKSPESESEPLARAPIAEEEQHEMQEQDAAIPQPPTGIMGIGEEEPMSPLANDETNTDIDIVADLD